MNTTFNFKVQYATLHYLTLLGKFHDTTLISALSGIHPTTNAAPLINVHNKQHTTGYTLHYNITPHCTSAVLHFVLNHMTPK